MTEYLKDDDIMELNTPIESKPANIINMKSFTLNGDFRHDIKATQLPNGVLIISPSGETTFVPDIKIVVAPNDNAYFDKIIKTTTF